MLNLVINQIIFLVILAIQFFCMQKIDEEVYKKKVSHIFVAIHVLFILYEFFFGYGYINGEAYAINLTIFFIFGMIFSVRQNIFILLLSMIITCFSIKLYGIYRLSIICDIVSAITFAIIGKVLKVKIYKKSYPSIISSLSYAIVFATIRIIITYLFYIVYTENSFFIYEYLIKELSLRILFNIICLFFSFVLFAIFFHVENRNDKSLLKIFIEKYSKLILLFCIFALVFSFVFNFLYIHKNLQKALYYHYELAYKELSESYEKYGEDYYEKDAQIQYDFDLWFVELIGAVYLLDENFNKYSLGIFDYSQYIEPQMMYSENFVDIKKYKKNEMVIYNHNGLKYMLIYNQVGKNHVVAFLSYQQIINQTLVSMASSLLIIIIYNLIVFLFVYYLFKNFVVNRIWRVNKKLDKITSGNYDEIFLDITSNEFKDLSKSINMTVNTLKENIEKIENKNAEDLELSRKIQVSQLPIATDVTIGYSAFGLNIPAEDVGGDFYDNFSIGDRKRMFLISDVSGDGIPAAMFMMKAKHTIINLAKQYNDMSTVFNKTNKFLSMNNDAMMFVTCFAILINLETGEASLINAGHNTPLIIRNINGEKKCEYLDIPPCRILGIDEESKYSTVDMKLNEGDKIVLYTDGVTEAKNIDDKQFSLPKLFEVVDKIKDEEPSEICTTIVESLHQFTEDAPQSDDITLYTIRYNGSKNVLKYNANLDSFDKGKNFLNKFIDLYDISVEIARNLRVVYDEIFCNIMRYAYENNGGEIILHINLINKNTIEMIFMDKGPEFNPIEYNERMKELSVDDKINGGMGIMFCMNIMDKCLYERDNDYNILKMYKKFI